MSKDFFSPRSSCLKAAMKPLRDGTASNIEDLDFWPRTVVTTSLLTSPQVVDKRIRPKNRKELWVLRCKEDGCFRHCSFLVGMVGIDEASLRSRGNTSSPCIAESLPSVE